MTWLTLVASLAAARLLALAPALVRTLALGGVLVIFFIFQGRSIVHAVKHTGLYQRHPTIALSDLLINEHIDSRMLSGKNVLPILVADYMPQATVFLYDETLYPKDILGWSGRDVDRTFVVGGYQPRMDGSLKAACLGRPHVLYRGMYIAIPLSLYEKEHEVFLMRDGTLDYLVPGSWRRSR
jgi:hypothetical protein